MGSFLATFGVRKAVSDAEGPFAVLLSSVSSRKYLFRVEPHVFRWPHHASVVSAHFPNAITTCFRVLVATNFVQFPMYLHTP